MYITDDPMTKQSVLRHAQKNGMGGSIDEVYWLKTNGAQSPTTRYFVVEASFYEFAESDEIRTRKHFEC